MKIIKEFMLREIAGEAMLIPVGKTVTEFKGMISLNGVAAFIWSNLEKVETEEELIALILEKYDVSEEEAAKDVHGLCTALREVGFIE